MDNINAQFSNEIFTTTTAFFEQKALNIFAYQYQHNKTYNAFCKALSIAPRQVQSLKQIPFLPIQFFKSAEIKSGEFVPEKIFESSGTTGSINSRHHVKELAVYEQSFRKAFQLCYGDVQQYCILGLLPSYLERDNSSLVYMVSKLIADSEHSDSGFYLYDLQKLADTLQKNEANNIPTLLIGVTYALLDFAAQFPMPLKHCIIMETGGMKGRRQELTRPEVHEQLNSAFNMQAIHSEYGMTELLSQAYSKGHGIFSCPPWMKVLVRAEDDPLDVLLAPTNERAFAAGVMNVIDLANVHSCAFIATDDVGKLYADGSFEILGRLDNSDLRGCGLMIL